MPLAAGTKLESYEILELLGAGGMGEVYRALDPALKREVAIKVLPASVSRDPERLRRFEQEAQAAARLNHPNILAVYHFGVFGDAPYLVSELLAGESLGQALQRGPLPMRKVVDYAVQVTHGLTAAHNHGIVHRDLKPDNLFVSKDGRVKILDFGLAKLKSGPVEAETEASPQTRTLQTNPGVVMGTAAYMAPEQVRGQAVDHHADIFALGCILYEMVTGKRAFQRPTSVETMSAILNEDAPALSQGSASAPPALQRVINRCLQKNPEQRFHTTSDLAFSLEALSDSGAISSASTPTAAPQRAWRGRAWLIAAGVVSIAALAYVGFALRSTTPPLRVVDYVNLSNSGHAGDVQETDGARIYLLDDERLEQISTSGGGISPVSSVTLPRPFMSNVSPDGSAFLAVSLSDVSRSEKGYPLYVVPFLGGTYRYVVQGFDGAWSPDGRKLAYSTVSDMNIINSDGTEAHKLASLAFIAYDVRWSPDGSRIRFSKGNSSLWEISSNGANLHQLLPNWYPSDQKCCGRWSPDGDFYVFHVKDYGEGEGGIYYLDERRGLFHQNAEQPLRLALGPVDWGDPTYSRDGKAIFASGTTPRGELVRFDSKTNQFQPFLNGLFADKLAFSKDGKYIAYVTRPKRILWRADRDGSNPVPLTTLPLVPTSAEWSPDSTQILFETYSPSGGHRAWIVPSQGGSPQQLLPQLPGDQYNPRWTPDGHSVMYEAGSDYKTSIFMLDLATHKVTNIPGSEGTFDANWSPDGSSIAAVRRSEISLFDTKIKRWSKLCEGSIFKCIWSRDSRQLFYLGGRAENFGIYRIPAAGGEPQLITGLKEFPLFVQPWFGLDSTDDPLLLKNTSTRDVYALKLERH